MIHVSASLRAIGFAFASFTAWVAADVLIKLAGEAHLPSYQIIFFMGIVSALFVLIKAVCGRDGIKSLKPRAFYKQSFRAFLVVGQSIFLAIALNHLPLAPFYVTVFMAPLIVALLASIFLHEKLGGVGLLSIVAGFLGVLLAINPFEKGMQGDWIGYAAALASTTCFALNTVWLRVMTQSESTSSLVFIEAMYSAVLCGLFMLFNQIAPVHQHTFLILCGVGLFCSLGNIWNYKALNLTKAATVMQFHYTQLVSGALFGYLIWHDIPTWSCVAGGCVITISGMMVTARTHSEAKANLI